MIKPGQEINKNCNFETSTLMKRNNNLDTVKGILIILVVTGHYAVDKLHDFLFLFHMPLFFIISGLFLQKEKLTSKRYFSDKAINLIIPYCVYLILDFFLVRRSYSFSSFMHMLYGGRAYSGVYWYITCFLFTLFLFAFLLKHFCAKTVKYLILIGGGIAVFESHLAEKIHFLQSPGIPWNFDVSLMAMVYIGIGFFYKEKIKNLITQDSKKSDLAAVAIVVAIAIFCGLNYRGHTRFYYFDMKPVYYKELISAVIIPCAFGLVLARIVYWFGKVDVLKRLYNFLALCGRTTIPIMFMHIPLNSFGVGYGRILYVIVGVGVPLVFTLMFNRVVLIRKLFGLPKLSSN